MTDLDLDAIDARANRHAQLERDASRDIALAEVSAAISSADDVPALVAEVRRLRAIADAARMLREVWRRYPPIPVGALDPSVAALADAVDAAYPAADELEVPGE